MCVVRFVDGHGSLQDDDAVVELLIDEMHGAASDFDAILKGLLLRIQAGKRGQQRWMDVQNALRKSLNKAWREQAHVTGEANELDAMVLERSNDSGIVISALAAVGLNGERC